jgi:hypothetical protein
MKYSGGPWEENRERKPTQGRRCQDLQMVNLKSLNRVYQIT